MGVQSFRAFRVFRGYKISVNLPIFLMYVLGTSSFLVNEPLKTVCIFIKNKVPTMRRYLLEEIEN